MSTVSPGPDPADDTSGDSRPDIAALYTTHALAIADALGDKPLCVVTGPRRFGKTTSLLPTLAGILRGRGKTVHIINARDYEGEPFTADTLPPDRFDVFIIDEANVLARVRKKTEELLRILHRRGNAIISMFTHFAGYESGALHLARIWQDAELSVSGQATNVVCLPQLLVTQQHARGLLNLYSPVKNETVRAQIVTYIVERAPLNPHVLLELAGARSISEVNEIVHHRRRTLFQGALSPDEYRKLEQSLTD